MAAGLRLKGPNGRMSTDTPEQVCWMCNGTGKMTVYVDDKGVIVSTTSEGWPDLSQYKTEERPCEACNGTGEPFEGLWD